MTKPNETKGARERAAAAENASQERRRLLKKIGRFAAVTAPMVSLLLAADSKPASAKVS